MHRHTEQLLHICKTEKPLFSRIIVYNMFKVKIFCQYLEHFGDFKSLTFVIVYNLYFLCAFYTIHSFQFDFFYAIFF